MMKLLDFFMIKAFRNVFALIALGYCGYMLDRGNLSPQAQTRFEDFIGIIISYFFIASLSTAKKDDIIQTMAQSQKQMADSNADSQAENLIKTGDQIIVTKEKTEE